MTFTRGGIDEIDIALTLLPDLRSIEGGKKVGGFDLRGFRGPKSTGGARDGFFEPLGEFSYLQLPASEASDDEVRLSGLLFPPGITSGENMTCRFIRFELPTVLVCGESDRERPWLVEIPGDIR